MDPGDRSEGWWEKPLRVPEREIHRYAEYVPSADLRIGQVYFRLHYLDTDEKVPELVPLVFVGRDLDAAGDGLYFQDAASYLAGVRWDDPAPAISGQTEEERFESWLERGHFETFDESAGAGVLEFEKALDLLLLCSLRRRCLDRNAPSDTA